MKEVILAKYGELALKGLNRPAFEDKLVATIKRRVALAGDFRVYRAQSTVYIEPQDPGADLDEAVALVERVFGIAAVNRAASVQKDIDAITEAACSYLEANLRAAKTFKVSGRRSDKGFALTSMEIAALVGKAVLERYSHLTVAMKNPDCEVRVEVRDYDAFVHCGEGSAAGGMPTGTSGRAAALLSGGIDSPVAAYMMAKRGLEIVCIHFMSPPYTSEFALGKAVSLAQRLSMFVGNVPLLCVPFTDVQVKIWQSCDRALFTVLMRRSMMRVAQILAQKERCKAIITGESLAQVASQTIDAISCTDAATDIPVFRPLIGMDKVEITAMARKIGTYEISILPFDDCCTVFTPKRPKTRPKLDEVLAAESSGGYFELEEEAAHNIEVKVLHFFDRKVGL
ncbi:MAG: tRNA 4-thiouridine(8) synthase ThiI [Oscillospiraceae bacterium]|nr:tRNA 4-thiouridine(8) synthase ThiI [Oscillospiraceae bacterium]